jgi:hypothetical protein
MHTKTICFVQMLQKAVLAKTIASKKSLQPHFAWTAGAGKTTV